MANDFTTNMGMLSTGSAIVSHTAGTPDSDPDLAVPVNRDEDRPPDTQPPPAHAKRTAEVVENELALCSAQWRALRKELKALKA